MQYSKLATETEAERLARNPQEKRATLRLWSYWNSRRNGGAFPSLRDFDVEAVGEIGDNVFMLDFRDSIKNPVLRFVGSALIDECGVDLTMKPVSDVPMSSVLSQVTRHFVEVFNRRGPVGLEDQYTNLDGERSLFRGILLPFSEDDNIIDFMVGAVTYRTDLSEPVAATLVAKEATNNDTVAADAAPEIPSEPVSEQTLRLLPQPADNSGQASASADAGGQAPAAEPDITKLADYMAGADILPEPEAGDPAGETALADSLGECRALARKLRSADSRSREALYRALDRAYAFSFEAEADPGGFQALCKSSRLKAQDRAPFTPIVKLVFGTRYDKTRLSEYAATLAYARRQGQTAAGFRDFLDAQKGGIKGCVRAERMARRGETDAAAGAGRNSSELEIARDALRQAAAVGTIADGGAGEGEFVVMVGRRGPDVIEVLAVLDEKPSLVDGCIRRAAKALDDGGV